MGVFNKIDRKSLQLIGLSAVMFAIMIFLRGEAFIRPVNLSNMMVQLVEPGFFALCISVAYLSRGIDLSCVAIANLVSIVNGMMFHNYLLPDGSNLTFLLIMAIVNAVVIGLACGLINGIFIAKLGIFPILVTLGTQSVFMGFGMILTQGRAIMGFPDALVNVGRTQFFGIPALTIIFLVVFLTLCIIVHKTPFGLKLQWMGSNNKASWYAGIDNVKVTLQTFMLSGLIAGIAGVVIMARTNSAMADYGMAFVFQALLICVLAGISPLGGQGKVYNIIFSLIAIQILSTGFNLLRVSPLIRDSLFGFLLVIALLLDLFASKWRDRRLVKRAEAVAAAAAATDE